MAEPSKWVDPGVIEHLQQIVGPTVEPYQRRQATKEERNNALAWNRCPCTTCPHRHQCDQECIKYLEYVRKPA